MEDSQEELVMSTMLEVMEVLAAPRMARNHLVGLATTMAWEVMQEGCRKEVVQVELVCRTARLAMQAQHLVEVAVVVRAVRMVMLEEATGQMAGWRSP